jgi:superfamily I DNA/RNA helicase
VAAELQAAGESTYLQIANEATHLLRESQRARYEHVIVDEGQDLHPAQWRLLRAAVAPGPDDFFIAADPYQRIYDNRVSLASLGSVRGRSRRLTVNYRTTAEILAWQSRCWDPRRSPGSMERSTPYWATAPHARPPPHREERA